MNKNAGVFCDVFGMVKVRKSGSLEDMDNGIRQRGNKDLRTETDKILYPLMQAVRNFDLEKIDDYLDMRDKTPFDKNWVTAYEMINICIDKTDSSFKNQEETLRETVCKSVANLTQHHELAGYISDDAGLIFTNEYFEVNNTFANQLFTSYQNNILPH